MITFKGQEVKLVYYFPFVAFQFKDGGWLIPIEYAKKIILALKIYMTEPRTRKLEN